MSVLIIAGAQKCLTSSTVAWFDQSPTIHSFGYESLNFEGRSPSTSTRELQEHTQELEAAGLIPLIKRPSIFHYDVVMARVADAYPDAAVTVILRPPVDRAVSGWHHARRMGLIDPALSMRDCIDLWRGGTAPPGVTEVIGFSFYAKATATLLERFPDATVVFFDEAKQSPLDAFAPVLERLSIKEGLSNTMPAVHRRGDSRGLGPNPHRLARKVAWRVDPATGAMTPRSHRLWRTAQLLGRFGTMTTVSETEQDRLDLAALFADDSQQLERVLARPLPAGWAGWTTRASCPSGPLR